MSNKFLILAESTISRLTNGGVLTGDTVKLVKSFKTNEYFKNAPEVIKAAIIKLSKSDKALRVIGVNNHYPSNQPGSDQNRSGPFCVELAEEMVPGYCDMYGKVSVCASMVQSAATYPNLPDVAPSLRRADKIDIKPVSTKPEEDEEQVASTRTTQQGDKIAKSDTRLPVKNTVIPSSPANGHKSPAVASYTHTYLPKE